MNIKIEKAAPEDVREILALQKLAYQSEAELYNDHDIPPLTQTLSELETEMKNLFFLKASDQQQIIGSVRGSSNDQSKCKIGRLIVHPDYQGNGIGTKLMNEIEKRFPDVSLFELFTGNKSKKNISLYKKLGYRITHEQELSPKVTIIFMQK